jgi:sugar lactone lactonase YvrE
MAAFSRLDLFGDGRADLGEGPCWHAARGTLWWIDITGQRVLESRLDGGKTREWAVGQMVGCVAPERSGGLVAALCASLRALQLRHEADQTVRR